MGVSGSMEAEVSTIAEESMLPGREGAMMVVERYGRCEGQLVGELLCLGFGMITCK